MARIVFQLDVDAPAPTVAGALNSADGIAGWWTDDVEFGGGSGSTMKLGFPVAPLPFELRVDEAGDRSVRWTSVGEFPPHWSDTTVAWTLAPAADGAGTTVHFSHDKWANDDALLATAAMTWGQLMVSLKRFAETGSAEPLFERG